MAQFLYSWIQLVGERAGLSEGELRAIESWAVSLDEGDDSAVPYRDKLPEGAVSLIQECHAFFTSSWQALLASTESLTAEMSSALGGDLSTWDDRITWERLYFRLIALYRSGAPAEADDLRIHLDYAAERAKLGDLCCRLRIDVVTKLVSQGRYTDALESLAQEVCDGASFTSSCESVYTLYRFFVTQALGHQATGSFSPAKEYLGSAEELISKHPALAGFRFNLCRRKLSLATESEDFATSKKLISQIDSTYGRYEILDQVLYSIEKLRYLLAIGDADAITRVFEQIEAMTQQGRFPKNVLWLSEAWCEYKLWDGAASEVLIAISEQLADPDLGRDLGRHALLLFYKGRSLAALEKGEEAIKALEECRNLAETHRFGATHVHVLLYLTGLEYKRKNFFTCRLLLAKAMELAREMTLGVQLACAKYLDHLIRDQGSSLFILVNDFKEFEASEPLKRYIQFYGLAGEAEFQIRTFSGKDSSSSGTLTLFDLVEIIKRTPGIYFCTDAAIVYYSHRGHVKTIDMDDRLLLQDALVLAIQQSRNGFELSDLHRLQLPNVDFDVVKHTQRSRMLLKRLRDFVATFGGTVTHRSRARRYYLEGGAVGFEVSVLGRDNAQRSRARGAQILEMFREKERMTTRELADFFGVSKPAIKPQLDKLVKQGALRLRKRGRSSYYHLIHRASR